MSWRDVDVRRVLDITVALPAVALTGPVMALAGLAVRLDSPGPVLFRQERVGRGGEPFRIRKFRTMRATAAGPEVTVAGDSRVTRSGRLLRASKIDELPQLFDVLQGTMSLVGPRPEVPQYVEQWPDECRGTILSVRPGITDPVSVLYRHESELLAAQPDPGRYYVEVLLPDKARRMADYVAHRTLVSDFQVLIGTVGAVLRRTPAPVEGVADA